MARSTHPRSGSVSAMAMTDELGETDRSAVEVLVQLGLSGYEARAYVALVRFGRGRGADIAREAHLPRQRIYDVLDSLAMHGIVEVVRGRPSIFTAVAPQRAFRILLARQREALARLEDRTRAVVADLTRQHENACCTDAPFGEDT